MNKKISAVVVTYNRCQELLKNISAVFSQSYIVDTLYIIDNASTDGTYDELEKSGYLNNEHISYMKLPENTGGAGGFYHGVKTAFDNKADYIILMDDDGRPYDNEAFKKLVECAEEKYSKNRLLMLNSLVLSSENELTFPICGHSVDKAEVLLNAESGLIKNTVAPFNGTLISYELVKEIGFPNKDFFLTGDENDYFKRAKKAGAFIATVTASEYYHPSSRYRTGKILGKKYYFRPNPAWKEYYEKRNQVYSAKKRGEKLIFIKCVVISILKYAITGELKKGHISFMYNGYKDGIKGRLGNTVKPGSEKYQL